MSSWASLNSYLNKKVLIITTEGNTFTGTLLCVDNVTNMALENAVQRFIVPADSEEESQDVPQMGTVMIRGDQIVICGLVDEELDRQIDVTKMRGEPILSTKKNT
ncbi:Sm-like ribonucleo protein [Dissoconium aciculare CBS 342.82]|uniref:LSM2-LSM8 complex subunit LSM8 n=1 Tax=Dissoconium aciculare CBS 342.82 TaxID=1314786 RepID=A0A6J3MFW1_9PEZI|nr:Sm-like ribonucleo protein [Dissoconium aciculare CBS 342.82]KAF1826549.1 Sm-like ribonucleo protein [Dissoconium aciculare CBS 342.82]